MPYAQEKGLEDALELYVNFIDVAPEHRAFRLLGYKQALLRQLEELGFMPNDGSIKTAEEIQGYVKQIHDAAWKTSDLA